MPAPKQKMRHPDLPGQPIWVVPSAVAQHMSSGWEPVDDDPKPAPKPAKPAPAPAAPEAPESSGDKPAKSRKPGPPPAPQGADRPDPAVTEE